MANVELQGMSELLSKFHTLGLKTNAVQNKALREGAKVLKERISERAPRSSSPKKPSKSEPWRTGLHAADHIGISNVLSNDGMKSILVGLTKGDNSPYFYLKFAEWGTSKQKATPFMGPAAAESKAEVFDKMKDVLRSAIKS